MKIEVGKKYVTRDGKVVTITDDLKQSYIESIGICDDTEMIWGRAGNYLKYAQSKFDLISEVNMLKLEVGKRYLTRNKEIVEIIKKDNNPNIDLPYHGEVLNDDSKFWYSDNGKTRVHMTNHSDYDIISEVNVIDVNKKYKTKSGKAVEILSINPDRKDAVIGSVDGVCHSWNMYGETRFDNHTDGYDLIEIKSTFQRDDMVLVSDTNKKWFRQYYSHFENNLHYCYACGQTSFSSDCGYRDWKFCIAYEDRTDDMVIV